jgi:UPF0042 nucleotide-binding protein
MAKAEKRAAPELIIITGMSGSGKGSVLRALEDSGYYAVDNLPVDLIPKFAELVQHSSAARKAALVVDVREGSGLKRFPAIFRAIRGKVNAQLIFLEADDDTLVHRFSETRRPHPLAASRRTVAESIRAERKLLAPIRALAGLTIDTSKFNVHEVREFVRKKFEPGNEESKILIYVTSFGFRHGIPADSDLVFDVRFLPNPNYIPKYKNLTGKNPSVAAYIRKFPQTTEFLERVGSMLLFLLPHYIREGKSYLTIGFGCTGGRHRSVMIAESIRRTLADAGYPAKIAHRDAGRKA